MEEVNSSTKTNKTSDRKAYMREYMKNYMPEYKQNNKEQVKIIESRKYWRGKLKLVGITITNEELEKYSHEDLNTLYAFIISKNNMEQKPELFKFIS